MIKSDARVVPHGLRLSTFSFGLGLGSAIGVASVLLGLDSVMGWFSRIEVGLSSAGAPGTAATVVDAPPLITD